MSLVPRSYVNATEDEIMLFARSLVGKRLRDLEATIPTYRPKNKGEFGLRVEALFGLERSNQQEPDFRSAGIELKCTELIQRASGWSVHWRTSVTKINGAKLRKEVWPAASVIRKIQRILFVFYQRRPLDGNPGDYVVDSVHLWQPSSDDWVQIKLDWTLIWGKVRDDVALHEPDTKILGAATKGPKNSKGRAFAISRPFVDSIYQALRKPTVVAASVAATLGLPQAHFEAALIEKMHHHVGKRIDALGAQLGVKPSKAKDYAARVVWTLLGARRRDTRLREFEDFGVSRKTVPLGPRGEALEHTYIMPFRIDELIEETWDDSLLKEALGRILFVPLRVSKRGSYQGDRVIGPPFFWTPSEGEVKVLKSEWKMFHDAIASGQITKLPTARSTQMLHVRTKGQNSRDIDPSQRFASVPRRAFWLNARFVADLVRRST
jgi:DNA mismatch repair protein MutH